MLGVPMSYFIDEGVGPIGEQELLRSQFDQVQRIAGRHAQICGEPDQHRRICGSRSVCRT